MAPSTIIHKAVFLNGVSFARAGVNTRGPYRVTKSKKEEGKKKSEERKGSGSSKNKQPLNEQPDESLKKELDRLAAAYKIEMEEAARKVVKMDEIRNELARREATKQDTQKDIVMT